MFLPDNLSSAIFFCLVSKDFWASSKVSKGPCFIVGDWPFPGPSYSGLRIAYVYLFLSTPDLINWGPAKPSLDPRFCPSIAPPPIAKSSLVSVFGTDGLVNQDIIWL